MEAVEAVETVKQAAEQAAEEVKPWFIYFSRFGFAAKGVVYIMTGVLLWQAAIGRSSAEIDREDVLVNILFRPYGWFLLGIIAVGLVGYMAFRLAWAILDPEHKEVNPKRIAKRIGYAASGLAYGALALLAFRMLLGIQRAHGEPTPEVLASLAFTTPIGQWLVGLAGVVVIGIGVYHFFLAYKAFFQKKLKSHEMSREEKVWSKVIARVGITARGFVYILIGVFLVQAAVDLDPDNVGDLGEAFRLLATSQNGHFWLAALAIGMVAYGLYSMVEGRYRRMPL